VTTRSEPVRIEAAGGLLWRLDGDQPVVAVVHRPKYDDWSLPKGKLRRGEHVLLGALREVEEETGWTGVLGRPLGETRYLKDGAPKRVRYWAMRATGGAFAAGDEVDQLRWILAGDAAACLAPDRDRRVAEAFARDPRDTWPVVVVRHGSAGDRAAWDGDDRERPLDEVGRAQARALVPILSGYGIRRVLSADVVRSLDTVAPYAGQHRLAVEREPLFGETGYAQHPGPAVERALAVVADAVPTVVSSQGNAMVDLLPRLVSALGREPAADMSTGKGGWWVLHLARRAGDRSVELVATERFAPLA
jgi:8-oxo-dGTP diphosphatase